MIEMGVWGTRLEPNMGLSFAAPTFKEKTELEEHEAQGWEKHPGRQGSYQEAGQRMGHGRLGLWAES